MELRGHTQTRAGWTLVGQCQDGDAEFWRNSEEGHLGWVLKAEEAGEAGSGVG